MSLFRNLRPLSEIDLFGISGKLTSPARTITTHFFQTKASADGFSSNSGLLKMLKPLRDNTRLDQINSIDDLLQRDVSDSRVSKGLIQYLKNDVLGSNNPVILPSIVVVLLPKDIFSNDSQGYPKPIVDDEPQTHNGIFGVRSLFENNSGNQLWSVIDIHDGSSGGTSTSVGVSKLTINTENVIPHILDGQHRMMAYKYLAGKVDFPSLEDSIYESFYSKNDKLENWESDLPVTLIWFSGPNDAKLDVKEYTRQMFLDINQTSQNITISRRILLNESDPKGVLTRSFYNYIGDVYGNQFSSEVSLAHSGFDMSVDISELNKTKYNLAGRWMPTGLFVPELLAYAIDWLMFGQQSINDIGIRNIQEKKERKNKVRFEEYFGSGMFSRYIEEKANIDAESSMYVISEGGSKEQFEQRFLDVVGKRFYSFLNNFGINKAYVESAKKLNNYIQNDREYLGLNPSGATEEMFNRIPMVWKKVYLGGEGLYYNIKQFSTGSNYSNYLSFIDDKYFTEIAKYYSDATPNLLRIKKFDTYYKTVAFFTGLVMSFDHLYRSNEITEFDRFIEEMSEISIEEWEKLIDLILELKSSECEVQYIKNIDPRSWIKYRAIVLHFLYSKMPRIVIYGEDNLKEKVCLERLIFLDQFDFYLTNEINNMTGPSRVIKADVKSGSFALFPENRFIELRVRSLEVTRSTLSKYFDNVNMEFELEGHE